jgi:hypothetical protein
VRKGKVTERTLTAKRTKTMRGSGHKETEKKTRNGQRDDITDFGMEFSQFSVLT